MQQIRAICEESIRVKQSFLEQTSNIEKAAQLIADSLRSGGKLLICGNGGSAADSQHISAELLGRYKRERRALPAIALSVDSSFLTAWSNDYNYESVFSRQVEALAKPGDILLCISTSGNSKNVLKAAEQAKRQNCKSIALTGGTGGALKELCDISIIAPSKETARIQECHILAYHAICEYIDEAFA